MKSLRAVDDEMKREVCDRLYQLWAQNHRLRLGQLIGNVYHSTDRGGIAQYYEEDYMFIEALEAGYRPREFIDGIPVNRESSAASGTDSESP